MDRHWLETLMLIRSLRPGPTLEDSVVIDCRGCGRKMPVGGLEMNNKVRCKGCGRIHKLTRKQLLFRYTEKVHMREDAMLRLGSTVVFFMSVLAVSPMASKSLHALLSPQTLSLVGLSACWLALAAQILCYGTGAFVGLGLGFMMHVTRKHTQDLGILGAVMTLFGGMGRILFYALGKIVGVSFSQTLPYDLVIYGLIGTTGSLWRASIFPHR